MISQCPFFLHHEASHKWAACQCLFGKCFCVIDWISVSKKKKRWQKECPRWLQPGEAVLILSPDFCSHLWKAQALSTCRRVGLFLPFSHSAQYDAGIAFCDLARCILSSNEVQRKVIMCTSNCCQPLNKEQLAKCFSYQL